MLEVTFTTAADDLMAFNRFVLKRSPARRQQFVFFLALMVCLGVGMTAVAYCSRPDGVEWVLTAVLGVVTTAIWPLVFHGSGELAVRKCVAEQFKAEGVTVTLTDEGIRQATATGEGHTRWGGVTEVVEDKGRLYLFTAPACAFILPRWAFERDEDYTAVRDFALAKLTPVG